MWGLVADGEGALVVALAGADVQIGAANTHFDGVIIVAAIGHVGREGESVLIARLFGDVGIKAVEIFVLGGIEGIAAGIKCVLIGLGGSLLRSTERPKGS